MFSTDSPLNRIRLRARRQVASPSTTGSPKTATPLSTLETHRLAVILEEPMEFMDSNEFRRRGAEARIYGEEEIDRPDVTWYRPLMDTLIPGSPRKVRTGNSIVLTGAQERVLFLKYNYARHRIRKIQDKLGASQPTLKTAREILRWYEIANGYRRQIAETNLALVLAMSKRTRMSEVDFADLVSEGNMALLRSVDKFDCDRGFKFSTYACRAILKAFSRHGMRFTRYRQRFPTDFDPSLERSHHVDTVREQSVADSAAEVRHLVLNNGADLSEVERTVIHHRFGIDGAADHVNLTLEQVGQIIGVTKERVRQIQNKALRKLREAIADQPRETPTPQQN